jgi:hypothetical protein
MIGSEAVMDPVLLFRIGLPHPITKQPVRGHTFACIRPAGRHPIPRRTARLGSQREATTNTPAPVRISYLGLGFLIVAWVALIFIEARYFYGVVSGLQVGSRLAAKINVKHLSH